MARTAAEFADLIAQAQKQALAALKQAQDVSIQATEAAVGLLPEDSSLGLQGTLPAPKQVVEQSFDFAGEILELQKAYALRLTEVLGASATRLAEASTKPSTKS
jgi:hypothetical protein